MALPGLTERLRRHSRNAGMMVGISMAAAIVICVAAFIWIYIQIQPLFSDFIAAGETQTEEPAGTGLAGSQPSLTPTLPAGINGDTTSPATDPSPTPIEIDDDEDADDPTEDVWEPTHQIRQGPNVNFRSGPNTISQTQGALAPGTPLRFLDDEQAAGGVTWMFFDIEDGTEGWIRDIDIEEIAEDE